LINVLSIDFSDELFRMKLTEKDIKEIQALAKEGRILERVTSSIAPSLYGLEEEKSALALQMFGGVSKSSDETTRIRGDIHIFLMGDPSTGKSQLLSFIASVAPRAIYASGKAATAAGLTAAAVRDEHDGRWTLEAGVLVLADLGLAAIDEMDKMSEQDRSSMHEAMEQQRISVAKAGISATLLTRCSVLGAANPKRGRIEENIPIIPDQVDIPLPLLQRFDAIFVFRDQPNEKIDSELAEHIVKSHLVGEMKEAKMKIPKELKKKYTPELNKEILSRYIHYAKENIHPVMTSNATMKIQKYYQTLRKKSEGMGRAMLISARHLEGIIRFSEASARSRLSNNVDESDVDIAIRIFEKWIRRISGETEGWDVDTILTGMPRSLKEEMGSIKQIVEDLDFEGKGVSKKDIIEHARAEKGISKERIELLLDRLTNTGELYENEIDKYRRVQQ
jgi:replicative DNA helicase Mcm